MARWRNFSIWRGRLPHWRADDVVYYLTFRHRRPLDERERGLLFAALLKRSGTQWQIDLLCVLPEKTELLVRVVERRPGEPHELSDIVERAKAKAGKEIVKASGERWPPFYGESYDRIVRDDEEFERFANEIAQAPQTLGLADAEGDYATLWCG